MFLLSQTLFLMLIAILLLGCGTDEDSSSEIPIVTIEIVRQEDEKIWFRLNATPPPTTDLAVLITAENLESRGGTVVYVGNHS